ISVFFTRARTPEAVRRIQWFLLGFTIVLVTFALSYPNLVQPKLNLDTADSPWQVGSIAPENIIALSDVEFLREEQFQQARKQAMQRAPLHFNRDISTLSRSEDPEESTISRMVLNDLENYQKCIQTGALGAQLYACIRNNIRRWSGLSNNELNTILAKRPRELEPILRELLTSFLQTYVILKDRETNPLYTEFEGSDVYVHDLNRPGSAPTRIEADRVINREDLYRSYRVSTEMKNILAEKGYGPVFSNALLKAIVQYLIQFDGARFDPEATVKEREAAAANNVKPGDFTFKIRRKDVIVKKGDVITDEIYRVLKLHQENRFWETFSRVVSIFVQQIILTALILYFAMRFAPRQIQNITSNLIVFITIWLFALLLILMETTWAGNLIENEQWQFFGSWIPVGAFVVLFALIFGEVFTMPLAFYLSFLVFISSKYDGVSLLISITWAFTGTILGARIKKRVHFITVGIFLALLGFALVTAGYLYSNRPILSDISSDTIFSPHYSEAVRIAMLSGLATLTIIVILPAYETLFNSPTRFKLTELADPSHPLLQEMFQKAPSTWTHTLMVAAMTEKACERLGLNTLLARTGIYFHDIGKMKNAGFFIENQHLVPRPENIDRDNPARAAKVIIDHVLDGIRLAEHYRLPPEVIAFIPEHHGTSTMAFFYHKALEKMKRKVKREDFRYPGPKPQSKETAIAMIADSVEAASRSLDEVNEDTVNGLINRIMHLKQQENQLDESGLTIGDLSVIRDAFREVLLSSFHSRPKYPNQSDTQKLEQRNAGSSASAKGSRKKGAVTKKSQNKKSSPSAARAKKR
ncbi:MAG: HDIG domain-containing protein, partial [Leptospiraceae bacterium]|nr:HDIG domain-containing protein [Leptospiraceae bacterium]